MAKTPAERMRAFRARRKEAKDRETMITQIARVKMLLKDHYTLTPIEECDNFLNKSSEEIAQLEELSERYEKVKEENVKLRGLVIKYLLKE